MGRPSPDPAEGPNPRAEYSNRLETSEAALAVTESYHRRAGYLKLLTLAGCAVVLWLSIVDHKFSARWLLVPAIAYLVLAVVHQRILRSRRRRTSATAFYRRGLARVDDAWAGTGEAGERFREKPNLYADDLDIFGKGGLFELLSVARTPMGEAKLAAWLLAPAKRSEILERHSAVKELAHELEWRVRLGVAGEELGAEIDPDALVRWATPGISRFHPALRILAAGLAIAATATFVYALATYFYLPLLVVLGCEGVMMLAYYKPAKAATQAMGCSGKGLKLLTEIVSEIEPHTFASSRLRALAEDLHDHRNAASNAFRSLATIADWIDARESMFVKIVDIPLLYTVQVGLAAEQWRRRSGASIAQWLEAIAQIEALLCIATYAFEHPQDPFPEFATAPDGGPVFEAEELGHPLIPVSRCVRNDVRLGGVCRALVISGSNMSGKSTLLRSVGINAVLAMAGAPVRARALRLTPVALGTRMRTVDSLQDGQSRFYAEILRIRQVLDVTSGELPVLFLFDELLEGTNSRERLAGAEGLVRALIRRGAIGMITTHDLALTGLSAASSGSIRNAHFREHIEGGKMTFDYTLRDGVVQTSNALELMRWIGLEV